jgi:hypothetical protein
MFDGESGPALLGGLTNGAAVATAIVSHVKKSELDNLSTVHVMLLAAATAGSELSDRPKEWAEVYEALREHMIVEMCDAKHCEPVLATLTAFLLAPGVVQTSEELFAPGPDGQVSHLYGVLSLLFPSGDATCQSAVAGFLRHLQGLEGSELSTFAASLLSDFAVASPDAYAVLEQLQEVTTEQLQEGSQTV